MNEKTVITNYVCQIAKLPHHPASIILDSDAQEFLMLAEGSFWISISIWLRNKILGEPLSPLALEDPVVYFHPYADYYAALFSLINELHSRTGNLNLRDFPSPAGLWFHCISTTAQNELEESGLFGMPNIRGKREAYEMTTSICRQLENYAYSPHPCPAVDNDLEGVVILEAQAIAKSGHDYNFRHKHFRKFLRTLRDTAKTAYNCKHLQSAYLQADGALLVTGKGTKLSQRKMREVR